MKMRKFKVGDQVAHLSHGVGTIQKIVDHNETKFYVIEIRDNGAPKKVFSPVENAPERIREIMSTSTADKILNVLKDKKPNFHIQTWNRRYREYMECIHSGKPESIAKVLADLHHGGHDLSFGERKLRDYAMHLIVAEFAISKRISQDDAQCQIVEALNGI